MRAGAPKQVALAISHRTQGRAVGGSGDKERRAPERTGHHIMRLPCLVAQLIDAAQPPSGARGTTA
jgi:hypothetical protein